MRRKPIDTHQSMAMTAFIVTLALSIIAFYYAYTHTAGYGRTVEGTQQLAAIWEHRKAFEQQRPDNLLDYSAKDGCCLYIEDKYYSGKLMYEVRRGSPGFCLDNLNEYLERKIKEGAKFVVDIQKGECPKDIVD